jgi:hypothetical protein
VTWGRRREEFSSLCWPTSARKAEKEGRESQRTNSLVEVGEQIERGLEVVAPREVIDKKRERRIGRAECRWRTMWRNNSSAGRAEAVGGERERMSLKRVWLKVRPE